MGCILGLLVGSFLNWLLSEYHWTVKGYGVQIWNTCGICLGVGWCLTMCPYVHSEDFNTFLHLDMNCIREVNKGTINVGSTLGVILGE